MPWASWVDLSSLRSSIRAITTHTGAALVANLAFWVVFKEGSALVGADPVMLVVVTWAERFVYTGIYVILIWNGLTTLYRGESNAARVAV